VLGTAASLVPSVAEDQSDANRRTAEKVDSKLQVALHPLSYFPSNDPDKGARQRRAAEVNLRRVRHLMNFGNRAARILDAAGCGSERISGEDADGGGFGEGCAVECEARVCVGGFAGDGFESA
jgi:hypothetical protein